MANYVSTKSFFPAKKDKDNQEEIAPAYITYDEHIDQARYDSLTEPEQLYFQKIITAPTAKPTAPDTFINRRDDPKNGHK